MNTKENDMGWYFKIQLGAIVLKVVGLLPVAWVWVFAPSWLFPILLLAVLLLAILADAIGIIPRGWL